MPFSLLNAEAMPDWFLDSNKRGNILDTFPLDLSQVETSQMCNLPSRNYPSLSYSKGSRTPPPQPVLAAVLGPHCSPHHDRNL